MSRIIAELAEPIGLQLEAVEDHRFPVELAVRVPENGTPYPLALRYKEAEHALRDSVAFQERLASGLAELHDALDEERASPRRWSRSSAWMLVAALLGLLVTLFVPELRSEYSALVPIWMVAMLLALGMQWVHRWDQSVEVIVAGNPEAEVQSARAVLVLLHRSLDGNVLTPAVKLENSSGAAIRYIVPATAERGVPKGFHLEALVQRAHEEIERPRLVREAVERRSAERRQLEAGVKNANLTLKSLQALDNEGRPAAE